MDRQHLLETLEKGFTSEWSRQAGQPNTRILNLIQDSFLIDEMVESLNTDLRRAEDKILTKRYQRTVLTKLSKQFAVLLFVVSDDGRKVNTSTIYTAQKILKTKGRCPIMPCIKPR